MPVNAWKQTNQHRYTLAFSNRSGVPAAIEKAAKDANMSQSTYLRMVIFERLQADGYVQKDKTANPKPKKTIYSGPSGSLHLPEES